MLLLTFPKNPFSGSMWSRLMAKSSRAVAAWMDRLQTKIAVSTITRKRSAIQPGKWKRRSHGSTLGPCAMASGTLGMASSVPMSHTVLTMAVTTTPAMMARGTSLDGLTVSSARLPAVSKP